MKNVIEVINSEIELNDKMIRQFKESYLDASRVYSETENVSAEWRETIHNMAISFLEKYLEYEEKNKILAHVLHDLEKY